MPIFKFLLRYENPNTEEIREVEIEHSEDADYACGKIMSEMDSLMESMERKNVYCSRRLVSCSACGQ